MVLAQLTGEQLWLEEPYHPRRARGLDDNDTGGLPEPIQQEIRAAALEAILAWRAGRPVAIPEPSSDQLVDLLTCAMGEKVAREFGPALTAEMGLRNDSWDDDVKVPDGFRTIIIGAGLSGLQAAVKLKRVGIRFTILEKREAVGGTWLVNQYPGAGVDTPNPLYSFPWEPYDWPKYFAMREDLCGYLEQIADRYDLRPHIRLKTEVEAAVYNAETQCWDVSIVNPDGSRETLTSNILFSAVGLFNPPKPPDIPGLDSFAGPCFHTNEWRHDVDLEEKRVAVIGNGASAMQTCPEIQHQVKSLSIFQRAAHWVSPFPQFRKPIPEPIRFLLREVPLYRLWYRLCLWWTWGDRVYDALKVDPSWPHPDRSLNAQNDAHRMYFTQYIESEVGNRTELLDLVVPKYPPWGKRMLLDNGWYRMLRNEKVELTQDPITEIKADRVVTQDGTEYEVDVLILATGFDTTRFLQSVEFRGRSGRTIREIWDDDPRAYLGTTVPDFPNLFIMYGPGTQPGHAGSFITFAEMCMRYVLDLLGKMFQEGLGAIELRPDVCDAYNEQFDKTHENMIWKHKGMDTYYRNTRGRVVVNHPYRNLDMFNMTVHSDLDEYTTEPAQQ